MLLYNYMKLENKLYMVTIRKRSKRVSTVFLVDTNTLLTVWPVSRKRGVRSAFDESWNTADYKFNICTKEEVEQLLFIELL